MFAGVRPQYQIPNSKLQFPACLQDGPYVVCGFFERSAPLKKGLSTQVIQPFLGKRRENTIHTPIDDEWKQSTRPEAFWLLFGPQKVTNYNTAWYLI